MKSTITKTMQLLVLSVLTMMIVACTSNEATTGQPQDPEDGLVDTQGTNVTPKHATPGTVAEPSKLSTDIPLATPGQPTDEDIFSNLLTATASTTPDMLSTEDIPESGSQTSQPTLGNISSSFPNETTTALMTPNILSVEEILESGLRGGNASPVHIAFRGTLDTDSIRCDWRGIARTASQRNEAAGFWLGLNPEDTLPSPAVVEILFIASLEAIEPPFIETAKSNFRSIAKGGLSREYLFLACYADYTVSAYLLGDGPSLITVSYDRMDEAASYDLYAREHDAGGYGDTPLQTRSGYESYLSRLVTSGETTLSGRLGSGETVGFLAPMGAHHAIEIEAWQMVTQWNLETDSDGVMFALRNGAPSLDAEYSQTLANLQTRITATTTTDAFADTRIAAISGLTQYYRDIGAYGDITPDDNSDETFMPAMPPPIPTCAGSTAVGTDPAQGLVDDCNTLLDGKDALAGTATLNWSRDLPMADWDGITLSAGRVHRIILTDKGLDGVIPPTLGDLTGLTRIDLDENSLTGEIPAQLGNLVSVTHLYLFENKLTGTIPPELGSMTALQILYLSDNSLTGTIPQKLGDLSNLTQLILGDNDLTGPIPDEIGGMASLRHFFVRDNRLTGQIPRGLSAIPLTHLSLSGNQFTGCLPTGMETANPDAHDLWRAELVALPSCGPTFGEAYAFSVARTSAAGDAVGTVSATPWDTGGTVEYTITAGNEGGLFQMDQATGAITLARVPAATDTDAHTLTVQGTDGHGQETTTTVTITLTE